MPSTITPLTPKPIPRDYTAFEVLLDEVRIYVPTVADNVALHVLRNSAIDFCRQTGLWQEQMEPIQGIAMEPFYELPLPCDAVLTYIQELWYGQVRIDAQSNEQLKKRYINDWTDVNIYNGPPQWFTHIDLSHIRLVPCPATNDTDPPAYITAQLVLQPSRTSLALPSDIAERWAEGIGYGARARLYAMPDQPFYNPSLSQQYMRMAMNEIGKGKIQANMARGRGPLHVNKRPFPSGV